MRVVLAHSPESDIVDVRRAIVGAGLDCSATDCIDVKDLARRMSQVEADLVLVEALQDADLDSLLGEARTLSSAPILAYGKKTDDIEQRALLAGASQFLDVNRFRVELDMALQNIANGKRNGNGTAAKRGQVISIFAPTPGSGGTMLAAHLASVLAKLYPGQVALIELARDSGDLALLTDTSPQHPVSDLCRQWQSLDATMLQDCATEHSNGLRLLVNSDDQSGNPYLDENSARRLAVLARVAFRVSVLALDGRLSSVEMEAISLSDQVALLVRPDVVAVRRAQLAVRQLGQEGIQPDRFQLIVNRWGQPGQLKQQEIEELLKMKISQFIPDDVKRLNQASNRGVLLQQSARNSPICRSLKDLAEALQPRK